MSATRRDVEFESQGVTLRGWLYPGAGDGDRPGVVMAHGMTAVKEMFLDRYAEVFASAGITTLVYDHLGFGASDGEPRQSPSVAVQLQGYRDAIGWLAARDGVDAARIGAWGSSYSGGHVITLAAEDLPIACAVAQVPRLGEGDAPVPTGGIEAIGRALASGDPLATIPATTPEPDGEGLMYADGAHAWFAAVAAERAPSWRNEVLVAGLVASGGDVPVRHLAGARVPVRLVLAPGDALTPAGPALALAPGLDLVDVVEVPGGHFDAYQASFAQTSDAACAWFRRHLQP